MRPRQNEKKKTHIEKTTSSQRVVDASLDDLYKRAMELLQQNTMDQQMFQNLVALKKEISARLQQSSDTIRQRDVRERRSGYVSYPDVTDPHFNAIIARKKEFAQGSYAPPDADLGPEQLWQRRCSPGEFILTPSQQVLRNFMSPNTAYDGLLLFHGVGTGKTCAAVTIAEQFPDKRVLVLVQPGLRNNFLDHIFDFSKVRMTETGVLDMARAAEQCTGTRYLSVLQESDFGNKQAAIRKIDRAIRARYTFMGTQQFAREITRIVDEAPHGAWERILRARFSNHVIIVDEAHHLRVSFGAGTEEHKTITPAIRNVLKYAEDVKLLLLTATPMFNEATDVLELVNLLLINDKRKPLATREVFERDGTLKPDGTPVLIAATRGYVSYLRGDDPFSFPLRLSPANTSDSQALPPGHPSLPSLDIKGDPIPARDAFKHTVLLASDMSAYQRRAYARVDQRIQEAREELAQLAEEAAVEDALEENDVDRGSPPNNAVLANSFVYGMSLSNVAFPVSDTKIAAAENAAKKAKQAPSEVMLTVAKLSHGRTGLDANFTRLQGRGLRLRYADSNHQFLSGALLGVYAPKIRAVLERALASEGIVFVYSKWIDSGIIPLAVALEHAGLSRYGQGNILPEQARRDPSPATGRRWTYAALTARKGDLSLNNDAEVDAARSPQNIDGSVVKVVLGSDKASEGLDFRNVREVHVLDPWYHFNKIEQIVGRAVRNCSHAALPLEKRNVTVYLHAARIRGSPRESIDVRAYRIAENKQQRIREVEAALIANSLDCNLNKHAQFYDPRQLNMRVDVVTSQGTVMRNFALGDRPPRSRVQCLPDVDVRAALAHGAVDDSTYDPMRHVSGVHSCKIVFVRMFRDHHVYTIEDVRRACHAAYPGVSDDAVMQAVQEVLDERTPVKNPGGRDGYVMYADDKYMFQPLDGLDEREGVDSYARIRSDDAEAEHHKDAIVFTRQGDLKSSRAAASMRASAAVTATHSASADADADPGGGPASSSRARVDPSLSLAENVVKVAEGLYADMRRNYAVPADYRDVVLDYVVDRVPRPTLIRAVHDIAAAAGTARVSRDHQAALALRSVRTSLERGGVLIPLGKTAFGVFDYYVNRYTCLHVHVASGKRAEVSAVPCDDMQLHRIHERQERALSGVRAGHLRGYVKVDGPGGQVRFKVLGSSGESSGCVCHQTSSIKVGAVADAIRSLDARLLRTGVSPTSDKKQLCSLYELTLRKKAPDRFARPAASARVFPSRGKRLRSAA